MQQVVRAVVPAGSGPVRDTVTLAYDDRHRRRLAMATDGGTAFLLDLPQAVLLRDGDGLLLEGGGVIAVRAAPEPLLEITGDLVRLAWHIGNRHVPAQIEPHRLLIRDDHVLADMVRGLGGTVRRVTEPFTPESGAYAGSRGHGQGHGHDHPADHG